MLALTDGAWAALASIAASVGTLIAVLVGNRRTGVVEQKVTTPADDGRTVGEILSEAHPEPESLTESPRAPTLDAATRDGPEP